VSLLASKDRKANPARDIPHSYRLILVDQDIRESIDDCLLHIKSYSTGRQQEVAIGPKDFQTIDCTSVAFEHLNLPPLLTVDDVNDPKLASYEHQRIERVSGRIVYVWDSDNNQCVMILTSLWTTLQYRNIRLCPRLHRPESTNTTYGSQSLTLCYNTLQGDLNFARV